MRRKAPKHVQPSLQHQARSYGYDLPASCVQDAQDSSRSEHSDSNALISRICAIIFADLPPCLKALPATRALPAGDFGPVDFSQGCQRRIA